MPQLVTTAELKAYARVDDEPGSPPSHPDDVLIAALGEAAEEYLAQATGRTFDPETAPERARLAVKALVAHWYEFREPVVVGSVAEVPAHVGRLINQLRDWRDPATIEEEAEPA